MVGLMQIMIYLLCVYLVYKGVEIFQIALVSTKEGVAKRLGIILGVIMIMGAFVVGAGAAFMADRMGASVSDRMNNIPNLR